MSTATLAQCVREALECVMAEQQAKHATEMYRSGDIEIAVDGKPLFTVNFIIEPLTCGTHISAVVGPVPDAADVATLRADGWKHCGLTPSVATFALEHYQPSS